MSFSNMNAIAIRVGGKREGWADVRAGKAGEFNEKSPRKEQGMARYWEHHAGGGGGGGGISCDERVQMEVSAHAPTPPPSKTDVSLWVSSGSGSWACYPAAVLPVSPF